MFTFRGKSRLLLCGFIRYTLKKKRISW
jgi:hypothetical protein